MAEKATQDTGEKEDNKDKKAIDNFECDFKCIWTENMTEIIFFLLNSRHYLFFYHSQMTVLILERLTSVKIFNFIIIELDIDKPL